MTKIYYLGPQASYCDCARDKFVRTFFLEEHEDTPERSILSVIKKLAQIENKDAYGVIPIENSVEGVVRETIDNLCLLKNTNMKILAETSIPVNHCLAGYAKTLDDIDTVISHPQAIAQCYGFITDNLREDVILKNELSTALAIKGILPEQPNLAAIGSEYAAKLYNVPVIRSGINDMESNTTRFVLIGSKRNKITGNDKTGFSFSTPNTPGALCKILKILDEHQINMTYIDSRPSKKSLGEYVFYVDIDGHVLTDNVSKALFEILQNVSDFQYFGSYTKI